MPLATQGLRYDGGVGNCGDSPYQIDSTFFITDTTGGMATPIDR